MKLRLTLRDEPIDGADDLDVEVDAPVGSTLGQAWPHLPSPWPVMPVTARVAGEPVGSDSVLGVPPLLHGTVIVLEGSDRTTGTGGRQPGSGGRPPLDVVVVRGPAAGLRLPLGNGRQLLGRATHLSVPDPQLSRVHLSIEVGGSTGVRVADAGSTNGSALAGAPLAAVPTPWPVHAEVTAGHCGLRLRPAPPPRRWPEPTGDGGCLVRPSPRVLLLPPTGPVLVPQPPDPVRPPRFPAVAVLLPAAASVLLALVLRSPVFLLFGLLSPLMLVSNLVSERRLGRRRNREETADFHEAIARCRTQVDRLIRTEADAARHTCPDADALLSAATGVGGRLWERGPADDDVLLVRLGTGAVPSRIRYEDRAAVLPPPTLTAVPLTVDLAVEGVLGITGPTEARQRSAGLLLAQLAVLVPPRHLRLVVLSEDPHAWRWTRWLPHVTDRDIAATDSLRVLRDLAQARIAALPRTSRPTSASEPIVVVCDLPPEHREVASLRWLLEHGPAVGIHLVCLADEPAELPPACRSQAHLTADATLTTQAAAPSAGTADLPEPGWLEAVARALCPLREPADRASDLPGQVWLPDLWPGPLTADTVAAGWAADPETGTVIRLGVGAGGPFLVDLAADGPHLLIAGTTGSGKSELLRTLVASLALSNSPDRLAMLLVDYKGGAAFGDWAQLPHVLGLVTDLDHGQTHRVLTSLRAELRAREAAFAAAGVADLAAYRARAAGPQIPRLVVVVDEFRMLATEHPELMEGLVTLAAVGRSLGLHLVLATQRPAGVVTADLRANVNLRIALRVQDAADSQDVLGDAGAAHLDPGCVGRALVRVGNGPVQPVQVALSAPPPLHATVTVRRVGHATHTDRPADPGRPGSPGRVPDGGGIGSGATGSGATGSRADRPAAVPGLIRTVTDACDRSAAVAPPPVWLPPLPPVLSAAELDDRVRRERQERIDEPGAATTAGPAPSIPLGLADLPEQRRQPVWRLDLHRTGNLVVSGAALSGRRTFVRSLVARTATIAATVWILDGAGGLGMLARCAHVGAVVEGGDGEHGERVLTRLRDEISRRVGGPDTTHDPVVLVVHGWEDLQSRWECPAWAGHEDALLDVLRRGPAVAVTAVITGGRGVLTGRIAGVAGSRLLLRPVDRTDALLAGLRTRDLPGHWPAGRAVFAEPTPVQVQLADAPDAAPPAGEGVRGGKVRPLPTRLTEVDPPPEAGWIGLGRGGPAPGPIGWTRQDPNCLLVSGAPGLGRTTVLSTLAAGALRAGIPVVTLGVEPLLAGARDGCTQLDGRQSPQPSTAGSAPALPAGAGLLLVDDLEHLAPGWEDLLLAHCAQLRAAGSGRVAVSTGIGYALARHTGLIGTLRRAGHGVLLGPSSSADADLLGLRLPRLPEPLPGRAVHVCRGRVTRLQIRDERA